MEGGPATSGSLKPSQRGSTPRPFAFPIHLVETMVGFTDPQIQHLMEYGDEDRSDMDFPDAAERDRQFAKLMSKTKAVNDAGIKDLIAEPHRHDLSKLEQAIADKLTARGFIEVRTPIIISNAALAKMTITPDHPLYKQVFFIDDKRCLRPMLAPNLYVVMRKLRDHTDGSVKIFEIGSCFRKESKSSRHLEEFTMMNLVDLGPEGDPTECLKTYIDDVMTAAGLEFHAGFGSIALLGSYDPAARRFERERVQSIDYGTDFYAPQTLESYDGRRIMIAWMQNWATVGCQPQGARWFGQMTLPRELSIRNGRLIQNPVRELENYRGRRVCYKDLFVTGETNLSGVSGRLLDLTVTVRPVDGRPSYQYFRLRAAKDGQRETLIRYKVSNSTLRLDRTHSGFPYDIVNVRDFPVRPQDGTVKIRLILDRFSLEVFVNDGEQAASMTIYTPLTARDISFEVVEGAAYIDVEHYSLNFEQGDAQ